MSERERTVSILLNSLNEIRLSSQKLINNAHDFRNIFKCTFVKYLPVSNSVKIQPDLTYRHICQMSEQWMLSHKYSEQKRVVDVNDIEKLLFFYFFKFIFISID